MKSLLITGASKGIGKATAELFLAEGYRVTNVSRSPCGLAGVQNVALDLCAPGYEEALEAAVVGAAEGAEVMVLVHNAAVMPRDTVATVDPGALRQTLELALVVPSVIHRVAVPLMPAGSSILYVGSTLSEKAVPGAASYVTSKHGLVGLMRATCQDLAGRGIHTVCVCPGFTDTEMLRAATRGDEGILAAIRSMVSFGRLIEPREIAETLLFAARSPVLNGAVVHAHLGQIER